MSNESLNMPLKFCDNRWMMVGTWILVETDNLKSDRIRVVFLLFEIHLRNTISQAAKFKGLVPYKSLVSVWLGHEIFTRTDNSKA